MAKRSFLIRRELWHHRGNTGLILAGLSLAVGLLIAVRMTTEAVERETRRVMRDLGFNLRILPRDTSMDHFWTHQYSDKTFPESVADRLAAHHGVFLTFNHLTPSLEQRYRVDGVDALLTGLGRTLVGPGEAKQPMGFRIPEGRVYLGRALADRLGVKRGESLALGGRSFAVERVLTESGTVDDIRIFTALADAQSLLGLPGQINEIKAIDCLCLTEEEDPLTQLKAVVEEILPEATVLQLRDMANARARQRQMAERFAGFAVPLVLVVGAVWVGLLGTLNARERRSEIGLWRALGYSSWHIAGLFLGRHLFLGGVAGILGFVMGSALALRFGPAIFPVTAKALTLQPILLAWAVTLTPVFAVLATLVPAMRAVAQDPADTLRGDS
jgi:putative ABC transport system permease protein